MGFYLLIYGKEKYCHIKYILAKNVKTKTTQFRQLYVLKMFLSVAYQANRAKKLNFHQISESAI